MPILAPTNFRPATTVRGNAVDVGFGLVVMTFDIPAGSSIPGSTYSGVYNAASGGSKLSYTFDLTQRVFVVPGGFAGWFHLSDGTTGARTAFTAWQAHDPVPGSPFGDVPVGTKAGIVTVAPEFVWDGTAWTAV